MKIDTIILGDYETNCYCIRENDEQKECLIIDPGLNPESLIHFLNVNELRPVIIVLTHGHVDHIAGVESLREHWPEIKVVIHENDAEMLTNPAMNLSTMAGTMVQARPAEVRLTTADQYYQAIGIRFQLFHTPGHTPGGICLYSAKDQVVFVGDTLFAGSIGRTDFPSGNHQALVEAIKTKLLHLPVQTTVYPGHGPQTTIGQEKKSNPFLT